MHSNRSDNKQPRILGNTHNAWTVVLGQQARRRGRRWIVIHVASSGRAHAGRVMVGGNMVHTCDQRVLVIAAPKWQVQHRGRIHGETLLLELRAVDGQKELQIHLSVAGRAIKVLVRLLNRCETTCHQWFGVGLLFYYYFLFPRIKFNKLNWLSQCFNNNKKKITRELKW